MSLWSYNVLMSVSLELIFVDVVAGLQHLVVKDSSVAVLLLPLLFLLLERVFSDCVTFDLNLVAADWSMRMMEELVDQQVLAQILK